MALIVLGTTSFLLAARLPRYQCAVVRPAVALEVAAPGAPSSGEPFVVQTWNVFGLPWPAGHEVSRRCIAAAAAIVASGTDVIALQEVWDDDSRIPLLATGHHAAWCTSSQGLMGQNGLLTLSRHPVLAADNHCFHAAAGIESLIGKGALRTVLALPGGSTLTVWNVHLQSGAEASAVRSSQIRQLASWIAASGDRNRLVLGDFNCGPGDAEWSQLCTVFAALGLLPRSGHEPTYDPGCNALAAAGPAVSIDHVFVEAAVADCTPPARCLCPRDDDGAVLSDHFALAVRLPGPSVRSPTSAMLAR